MGGESAATCQRRDDRSHGGRRLDAIAALSGQPEESLRLGIETGDQGLIGDDTSQARPCRVDARNLHRRRLFDTINGDGDVQFVGLNILRRHRRFVKSHQAPAAFTTTGA